MSRKPSNRAHRFSLEPLEPRTVLSAVVAGPFAQDLWPNGQIPYVIDPLIKDPSGIIQAINEYNDETDTQWIPRTNQAGYVDFEYADLPGENEAQVGYQQGVEQYAGINDLDLTYIILHEMGHVLGFWHEQQMLDASSYIIINNQNLLAADASVWAPFPAGFVRDVGPFDYSSIMLYNGYVGSANGLPVATELNGTPLPQNTVLSADDIAAIDTLYPVRPGQAQVPRNVTASDASTNQIQITWTDTNAGQATYTVERAVANGTFEPIATLPVGSTSYIDDDAAGATLYEYMIVAATAANVPAVSQIVYAALPSAAPTNLTGSLSGGMLSLQWTDHTGGAAPYVVEWSVDGSAFQSIGSVEPGTTTYTVPAQWTEDLSENQYTFRVQAQMGGPTTQVPLWDSDASNTLTVGPTSGGGGGGTTGGGGGEAAAPQVLGVVEVQQTKKKVSAVTIAFNEAMAPDSVNNPALYRISGGVPRRRRVVFSKKVKIKTVLYAEATDTVSISLAKPYKGEVKVSLDGMIDATDGASSESAFTEVVR